MTSGLLRLLHVAINRFSRDPSTRAVSSRLMVTTALALYAEHTSTAEAAVAASEAVAGLVQADRLRARGEAA